MPQKGHSKSRSWVSIGHLHNLDDEEAGMAGTKWEYGAAWLDVLAVEAGDFLAYIWPTRRRIAGTIRIYNP